MELKHYQQTALTILRQYLSALKDAQAKRVEAAKLNITFKWDEAAWESIGRNFYKPRKNGLGEFVPMVCFKVPTGGGKTLLAVKAIDVINSLYRGIQTGLVLWIVPTSQIYNQTLKALRDRAHPYRIQLNMASGDRTVILEKDSMFSPDDVHNNLVVLLLMLPSANRQNKETLKMFQDRGGFESFFPAEDHYQEHLDLLKRIPNLDAYDAANGMMTRIVKTSLGNTLRILNPTIILDEGHKTYGELAQSTLLGFNPSFVLELSATPDSNYSNILVNISGQDVLREGMIKLDIHVDNRSSVNWHDTMRQSHLHRKKLEEIALLYENETGTYIRPICLIQVERTGAKQREAGFIHAEDVREFLIARCNVLPDEIAVKSSERDDIENIDLLSRDSSIRYIITKQALQEGWDCPFAYVLTVLTNPKAAIGITQLVGRILRQPYARKTGRIELDESYVFCYKDTAGDLLRAVRRGLVDEGLGDLTSRVISSSQKGESAEIEIRSQYKAYVGKVYLPCFVVPDSKGGWREVGYETDVLSRVNWDKIKLNAFDKLQLNTSATQNFSVAVGLDGIGTAIHTAIAPDMPLDLVFMTQHLLDVVPNPWYAYEFAENVIGRLRKRYDEQIIKRNLGFVLDRLKKSLIEQRVELSSQVFRDLIDRKELNFYLISGCAGNAIPERIRVPASRKLTTAAGDLPSLPLFEYREEEFNDTERAVALYLDQQQWVLAWLRNVVKTGYSVQGWKPNRVYPDFIALGREEGDVGLKRLANVFVLEIKGLHLKNEDTQYKQDLFKLCNELSKPTPWDEIAQEFRDHKVQFQVVFEDEWQKIINAMFQET